MAASGDKRYLTEEEIDYLMKMKMKISITCVKLTKSTNYVKSKVHTMLIRTQITFLVEVKLVALQMMIRRIM